MPLSTTANTPAPTPEPYRLVFLDIETITLDDTVPTAVWEIGAILRDHTAPDEDQEFLWQVRPDLSRADPGALRISRFYERTSRRDISSKARNLADDPDSPVWSNPEDVALRLARLLSGATVVGAVPDFDYRHLRRFLADHGQAWAAHYHLRDIEALAAGYLMAQRGDDTGTDHTALAVPWRSDALSSAIGVDPTAYPRHTALGDARWVRAQWDVIFAGTHLARKAA